jgi:hypothetical protein
VVLEIVALVSIELVVGLLAFVESAKPAVLLVGLVVVVVVSVTVELLAVLGLVELGVVVSVAAVLLFDVGKVDVLVVVSEELLGRVEEVVLP